MARSSTSPKDLHEGLVERLRAGKAISTADIPSPRLRKAVAKLRQEGIEVTREKMILNPGEFPAKVRAVYRVPKSPPATNGASVPAQTRPERRPGPAAPDIRRRLIEGEELRATQVAEEYGVHNSLLGQAVEKLRKERYLITVRKHGRQHFYRCSPQPAGKPSSKVPKWVTEAEEEEEANGASIDGQAPARAPRLLSVVWKTEIVEGEILLTIRDGDEVFLATVLAHRP